MKYELILSWEEYCNQPLYYFGCETEISERAKTELRAVVKEFSVLDCVRIVESSRIIFKITFGDQESMLKFQLKYL